MESSNRRSGRPRGYVFHHHGPVTSGSQRLLLATLKNDDAEDSGEESDGDEFKLREETRALRSVHTKKGFAEKQPTGRVVGIIKRNWRAYVL